MGRKKKSKARIQAVVSAVNEARSKKIDPGWVWTPTLQIRPFVRYREIKRGRDAGRLEITIKNGRSHKLIVDRDQVRRFPFDREKGVTI